MPLTVPPSIKLGICGGVAGSVVNVVKETVFVGFEASKSLYDKNDNRFAAVLGDGDGESSRAIAVGEGGVIDDAGRSIEARGDGLRLASGLAAGLSTSTSVSPGCESVRIAAAESRTEGTESSVFFARGIL